MAVSCPLGVFCATDQFPAAGNDPLVFFSKCRSLMTSVYDSSLVKPVSKAKAIRDLS